MEISVTAVSQGKATSRPEGQEAMAEVTTLGRGPAPRPLVVNNAVAKVLANEQG